MNPNLPEWTASENATLRHLVQLGLDDPDIGIRLGKSTGAVRARRSRMRIPRAVQRGYVWQPKEDARLKEYWATKTSTAQIANLMAEEFGRPFTKNAIIGRANRLQQASRKPVAPRPKKPRVRPYRLVKPTFRAPPPPALDHAWKLFRELKGEVCHFIEGEPRGMESLMCGLPTVNTSYCQYHYWITHRVKNASVASRAVASAAAPSLCPPSGEKAAALFNGEDIVSADPSPTPA